MNNGNAASDGVLSPHAYPLFPALKHAINWLLAAFRHTALFATAPLVSAAAVVATTPTAITEPKLALLKYCRSCKKSYHADMMAYLSCCWEEVCEHCQIEADTAPEQRRCKCTRKSEVAVAVSA